jgi:branched-chain amino acid transport system permease protein
MGIAGYALGNMVSVGGAGGESKGLLLGWDPTASLVLALLLTTGIAFVFGAVASRSYGIYFLMLTLTFGVVANLFFGSVTKLGGFSPIAGIDRRAPGFVGDVVNDRERLYYIALGCGLVAYFVIKYIVRTPFGLSLQAIRDEPVRTASLGFSVPLHRMLAFTLAGFFAAVAGVLAAWWNGQVSPDVLGLNATISLLVMAVIGGLGRIEGAWLGALAFIVINNEATNRIPSGGLPVIGGTFNTVIGFVFLAIVLVSPDGLMGIWERLWELGRRRGGPPALEVALAEPGKGTRS